jgi:O-succinylbenzoic acid--CoA ligase
VPHAEWGEVPVAYVVCSEELDAAALTYFCRQQFASFKVPREFHRVTTLPRNAMGKLQKHLLK